MTRVYGQLYALQSFRLSVICLVRECVVRAVPPMSIAQAGCACVCRSKAWEAKIVTSAWWVHHDQVSSPSSRLPAVDCA